MVGRLNTNTTSTAVTRPSQKTNPTHDRLRAIPIEIIGTPVGRFDAVSGAVSGARV